MKSATLPQTEKRAIWARETLSGAHHLLFFFLSCLIIAFRRPDALFPARFFAEDGTVFYASAYNHGWWRVLFSPYQGYLHLLPRLAAGAALLVPLVFAPLVENIIAIAVEALAVNLLLSSACSGWGTLRFRAALAGLYLALPNTAIVLGSVTESQWILAFCALLILLAAEPPSRAVRIFCGFVLVLSSLTGPFCIFLLPFAIWRLLQNRHSIWRGIVTGILAAGAAVQLISLVTHAANRAHSGIGAGIRPLFQILGAQVCFGALFGRNALASSAPLAAIIIGIAGSAFLVVSFFTSNRELRALQVFSAALFAASIIRPAVHRLPGHTIWQEMAVLSDAHYWFFPCLAVVWSVAYAARSRHQLLKIIGVALAALLAVGIIRNFRQPLRNDFQFALHVRQFEQASRGTTVDIPIYPDGWKTVLVKH